MLQNVSIAENLPRLLPLPATAARIRIRCIVNEKSASLAKSTRSVNWLKERRNLQSMESEFTFPKVHHSIVRAYPVPVRNLAAPNIQLVRIIASSVVSRLTSAAKRL
jgi:hypothetical protein